MNLFNGDEDLQRRYADALKTSVDKTFGVEMNNERSLVREITEGFEALKSMRNNEPVAWMVERTTATKGYGDTPYVTLLDATKSSYWIENEIPEGYTVIPLYTHPVKEVAGFFGASEPVYPTVKELTDEEILELCPPNHSDMMNEAYTIDFARAILRKAQEK
jgi:hypothetical protein